MADVLVIRSILESSMDRASAEQYLLDINRTWSIWLGIGDYASQKFDLVGYKQVRMCEERKTRVGAKDERRTPF